MTIEQFERAKELERQMGRLRDLLKNFKKDTVGVSPSEMTGYSISKIVEGCEICIFNIQNSELALFVDAIESQIAFLEHEFNRL